MTGAVRHLRRARGCAADVVTWDYKHVCLCTSLAPCTGQRHGCIDMGLQEGAHQQGDAAGGPPPPTRV